MAKTTANNPRPRDGYNETTKGYQPTVSPPTPGKPPRGSVATPPPAPKPTSGKVDKSASS